MPVKVVQVVSYPRLSIISFILVPSAFELLSSSFNPALSGMLYEKRREKSKFKRFFPHRSHQAGISESIDYVVKLYDADTQLQLVNNVFVTGGCATLPG